MKWFFLPIIFKAILKKIIININFAFDYPIIICGVDWVT
jgi:hypothetical protein